MSHTTKVSVLTVMLVISVFWLVIIIPFCLWCTRKANSVQASKEECVYLDMCDTAVIVSNILSSIIIITNVLVRFIF